MISWLEVDGKSVLEYLMTSKRLENYFLIVPYRMPLIIYYLSFVTVLLGWIIQLYRKGLNRSIRYLFLYSLTAYVALIICSTCIFRDVTATRNLCMSPLWSYIKILDGEPKYIVENLMNILVFLPVGLLMPLSHNGINFKKVVIIGTTLSLVIEIIQFSLKTGMAEFDDVFHNTLGTAIGYILYLIISFMLSKMMMLCFGKCKKSDYV